MINVKDNFEFEIPYNFDKNLIAMLKHFDSRPNETYPSFVNCIYVPPYYHDYKTIFRTGLQLDFLSTMKRKDYESHINYLNFMYPGKV